jgi:hypothetical protein
MAEKPFAWVVAGVAMPFLGAGIALSTGAGILFWAFSFVGGFLSLTGTIALGVSLGLRHARSGGTG